MACGHHWAQGRWAVAEVDMSINWKELHTYYRALSEFQALLRGKLVIAKLDNTCSVHYINHGTGRIPDLADLARSIRLRETTLGIESIAVHLPGVQNVMADALSRLQVSVDHRDPHPDKMIRRSILRDIQGRVGNIEVDGMGAEDGHNAIAPLYFHPSSSIFAQELGDKLTWVFPPEDLLDLTISFFCQQLREQKPLRVLLCVPLHVKAPWFNKLRTFTRVAQYRSGSSLFVVRDHTD